MTTVVILRCHNTQHDRFTHFTTHYYPRGIRPSPACFLPFCKHLRRGNGGERRCRRKSPYFLEQCLFSASDIPENRSKTPLRERDHESWMVEEAVRCEVLSQSTCQPVDT